MRVLRTCLFIAALLVWPFVSIYLAGQHLSMYVRIDAWATLGRVYQIWGFGTVAILAGWTLFHQKNTIPFIIGAMLVNVFCIIAFAADDFTTFVIATKAYMSGANPYIIAGQPMPFPPIILYVYAGLHSVALWTMQWAQLDMQPEGTDWCIVFFLTSVWQWAAVWGLALLTIQYSKLLKLPLWTAFIVIFASCPTWSVIRFDQPTATVTCCILGAILLADRYDWLKGIIAAMGTLLKVYPVVLIWPWILRRRWNAIGFFAVALVVVGLIEWQLYHGWLWLAEWHFITTDPSIRNGVVETWNNNTSGIATQLLMLAHANPLTLKISLWSIKAIILAWFVWRFFKRRKWSPDWLGDLTDALAVPLLLSPDMWEHSFMFAIPVWLYWLHLQLQRGKSAFWPLVVFVLIFALPVVQWFPWGYTRWIGVIIGMIVSEPGRWFKYCG